MSVWICGECTARYSVGAPRCPQCKANDPREDMPTGAALPMLTVACPDKECPAHGVRRRVLLRTSAPGVVERPPLHCAACGHVMETVTEEKEETGMAKITVHGGATNEAAADGQQVEGGEQSSPTPEGAGTTSSTSSEKPSTSPETSETDSPRRARTTGSRSAKARTGDPSAPGTAGDQTAPTSKTDSDKG